jgi:acyl carrier protein
MHATLITIINELRQKKQLMPLQDLKDKDLLREDLGLDSLDLAVLAIKLEKITGKDILAARSRLGSIGDVKQALN